MKNNLFSILIAVLSCRHRVAIPRSNHSEDKMKRLIVRSAWAKSARLRHLARTEAESVSSPQ